MSEAARAVRRPGATEAVDESTRAGAAARYGLVRRLASDRGAVIGSAIVLLVVAAAVAAPLLPLAAPDATRVDARLAAPGAEGYLLGSDQLGRDILSRVVWGARVSLLVGVLSVGAALLTGGSLGLIAGFYGKLTDTAIMRVVDALMAFPYVLLAILLVAALGPGLVNALLAVAVANVSFYARGVRSAVLVVRGLEYVEASRSIGATDLDIMRRQILPNIIPTALVAASLNVGWMITETAGLSFIGLGAQPPTADWGTMLADGRAVITVAYHVAAVPGAAIFLLVLGTNLVGEALRDVLDPRFR